MKALRKLYAQPGIWLDEIDKPKIAPDEVLIKVEKTAICGTDIHIYNWDEWAQNDVPIPMTIGHEFMGKITEIGSGVHGYHIGDRVSGEGHIVCGLCRNCRCGEAHLCGQTIGIGRHRAGSFAEYIAIPAANVVPLPQDLPDDLGALLDPFGNAVHTALAFDLIGENVLITGAGPIGIMAATVARHVGANKVVVTDFNPYRLQLLCELTDAIPVLLSEESLSNVTQAHSLTEGFDVGLEMSGATPALREMIQFLRPGGKIALLGILPQDAGVDWQPIIFKGLTLQGIYGRKMFTTWHQMIRLLQSGLHLAPMITHKLPASEFQQGFNLMRSGQTGKVVLDWTV